MTKAQIVNEISLSTGYDKKTIQVIVESFSKCVKKSVSNGENVYMRGFGSFVTKIRKAKTARNITSSTSIAVPAHRIVAFRPAAEFADEVRKLK